MDKQEKIILGGGCFWCIEAVMNRLQGVIAARSGYAGGTILDPSYEVVSSGTSGYAEVVEVIYDATALPLDVLLLAFFTSHDPTSLNKQGNDIGEQYRSCIFFTTEEQQHCVEDFIKKMEQEGNYDTPIVTTVERLDTFYPAEDYHQKYYDNNPSNPYCSAIIDPKIQKLRASLSNYFKE